MVAGYLGSLGRMNTTLAFRAALGVTALSGVLHAYENFAKAAEPSLAWFLWAMLPYGVCLVVWVRSSVGAPSLAGVIAALAFDLVAHYDVFVHPTRSTAALAMIFVPLWSTLLFCPVAMLAVWLAVRRRDLHEPHAP